MKETKRAMEEKTEVKEKVKGEVKEEDEEVVKFGKGGSTIG